MSADLKVRKIHAKLRGGKSVTLPMWRMETGRDGPCFVLVAAQHGNEVQGAEAIRRFIELARPKLKRGSVLAVPFANLPAIRDRRPHMHMKPEQAYSDAKGFNMNHHWHGDTSDNDSKRLATAIRRAVDDEGTHVLDIHCWSHQRAAALLIPGTDAMRALARDVGHLCVRVREPKPGLLSGHFCATGRMGVTYECSGQYMVDETEVKRCLRVVTNMAKHIGLLPGRPTGTRKRPYFSDRVETTQVKAPRGGLFVESGLKPADTVKKGQLLGHLLSDTNLNRYEIKAPCGGFLTWYGAFRKGADVGLPGRHPYVTRGDQLAEIARHK